MWRLEGIKTSSAKKASNLEGCCSPGSPERATPSLPSFSKPRPAVPVKAEGENPHNPNQHGEVGIRDNRRGGRGDQAGSPGRTEGGWITSAWDGAATGGEDGALSAGLTAPAFEGGSEAGPPDPSAHSQAFWVAGTGPREERALLAATTPTTRAAEAQLARR